MRALVTSAVWKESPVTVANPKRVHFRFELNRNNFATLLQQHEKLALKKQQKNQTQQQQQQQQQ
jgi:hypothetical protein